MDKKTPEPALSPWVIFCPWILIKAVGSHFWGQGHLSWESNGARDYDYLSFFPFILIFSLSGKHMGIHKLSFFHYPSQRRKERKKLEIRGWSRKNGKLSWNGIQYKAMAPHSSTLAWRIPWTEEPGRQQSMGSLRVGHDWATSLPLFTFMHWRRKRHPTPLFLPGESQGWRSLVGCRLWGHTEPDTTAAT